MVSGCARRESGAPAKPSKGANCRCRPLVCRRMGNEAMAESASARRSGAEPSGAQAAAAQPDAAEICGAERSHAQAPSGADAGTRPSLSPSRAGDFLTCPLLYRFRVIDRLPEPPSPAAARGTLVHAVLERLFDRPAAERTPQAAKSLLSPQWDRLVAESPELATLFTDQAGRDA